MTRRLTNVGASVRQRLLNFSRERHTDFGIVLIDYALERFLFRLGRSEHRNRFVLKGAMLFRVWADEPHRSTRDLDLLAYGDPDASVVGAMIQDICRVQVDDDGVEFEADTMRLEDIREGQEYLGVRARFGASIGGARVPVQIDVGFGDAVTPPAVETTYPTILDYAAPVVRTYPRETVVAEKLHAMVEHGMANSRMKDFYDVYALALHYTFDGTILCAAIAATFNCRSTPLPTGTPIALSAEFSVDSVKITQWRAFVTGGSVDNSALALDDVVVLLGSFLLPPMNAAAAGKPFAGTWVSPGPWVP